MTVEKTIAVVGGGFAGVFAAKNLEKQVDSSFRVVLIEKVRLTPAQETDSSSILSFACFDSVCDKQKTHFYNPIAGARAAVQDIPVLVPYTRLFKHSKNTVVHATAERLGEHTVELSAPFEGSTVLHFDYLVSHFTMNQGLRVDID